MTISLPESDRFFAVEIAKLIWLPAVAAANPTRPEITAGTQLQDEVVDLSGWDPEPGSFSVNTLGSRFSPSMTGRTAMQAATVTYAASVDGEDIRTVHTVNDKGFMLFAWGGDVEDYPGRLFPARVSAISPVYSVGEEEHRIRVSYSIPNTPRDIVLPAAA